MKKMFVNLAVLSALCFGAPPVRGDVYLLGIGHRTGSATDREAAALDSLFSGNELYHEKMTANGVDVALSFHYGRDSFANLLAEARRHERGNFRKLSSNSLLIDVPWTKNTVRRYIVFDLGRHPALIAEMTLPKELPPNPSWPDSLPQPPGARPRLVIQYPAQKGIYGSFDRGGERSAALRSMALQLEGQGWKGISGEPWRNERGRGEFFLSPDSRELLWIGVGDRGDGVVYRRKTGAR